ncbi:hypothetical protein AMECASPLE_011415, partial [Ameca splendens]
CHERRKSLIATSLIVAVSLFVVVMNFSEKPYFLLQPVFGQTFSTHWMFSKQSYKAFKPHLGYVSIPKQEASVENNLPLHLSSRRVLCCTIEWAVIGLNVCLDWSAAVAFEQHNSSLER